jgi:hypothetical protein
MRYAGRFCVAKITVKEIKSQACSEFTTQISNSVGITTLALAKFLTHGSIHLITLDVVVQLGSQTRVKSS